MTNDFFSKVQGWATQFQSVKDVQYVGDWEDILNLQLNDHKSPLLVVELPDLLPDPEQNWTYESAISILKPIPPGIYNRAFLIATMSETLAIVRDLTRYIFNEHEVQWISTINPITKATNEHLYGWRFLFRMEYQQHRDETDDYGQELTDDYGNNV